MSALLAVGVLTFGFLIASAHSALRPWSHWSRGSLPPVVTPDVYHLFVDDQPVRVTIRGGVAPWGTTAAELRTSDRLWRRMHLADWNTVSGLLRRKGLDHMLAEYRGLLMRPSTWDQMNAERWDRVPQPIRTLAYRQMVAYWAGFYKVSDAHRLDPREIREVLAAIVMTESWFDHRAVSVSRDGNRDLGLAQASDYARARFRTLHAVGVVDVFLSDADYFDPWKATRFLARWFTLVLDESGGDVPLAVRAYHRGTANAGDALGTTYLRTVERRLDRFIRNRGAPAAWEYFWRRGLEIEREEWPWLSGDGDAARSSERPPTF